MNVAFFLTPLAEVEWVPAKATMAEALRRMARHRYAAVPVLDDDGRYVGTLTAADLLWKMAGDDIAAHDAEGVALSDVERRTDFRPVDVTTAIEALIAAATDQNFVPVVDSRGVLMGIVRRKSILEYCARLIEGRPARPPSGG